MDPDIDRGIAAWIVTNQVVAQKLVVGDYRGAKSALTEWAIHHLISMTGSPDGVGDLVGDISDLGSWVSSLMPAEVKAWIKDFKEDVIYDTVAREAVGMRWSEIEVLGTPEIWLDGKSWRGGPALFEPSVRAQMNKDMGNYTQELTNANASTFKPFHNTVVMGKLVLMGPEGVNALLAQAGARSRIGQNIMLGWMRSLDGSEAWENGSRTRAVFDPLRPYQPAGPVAHSPLYDERRIWCSLFTGFGGDVAAGGFEKWKLDGAPMEWRFATWERQRRTLRTDRPRLGTRERSRSASATRLRTRPDLRPLEPVRRRAGQAVHGHRVGGEQQGPRDRADASGVHGCRRHDDLHVHLGGRVGHGQGQRQR